MTIKVESAQTAQLVEMWPIKKLVPYARNLGNAPFQSSVEDKQRHPKRALRQHADIASSNECLGWQ